MLGCGPNYRPCHLWWHDALEILALKGYDMERKHTPGPWTAGPLGIITGGHGGLTTVAESVKHRWALSQAVAGMTSEEAANWCRDRYEESQANERLICSAPAMLDVLLRLREALDLWQSEEQMDASDFIDMVESIIGLDDVLAATRPA